MLRSLMGFDWRKSKAHWLLLSKFIHPKNQDDFTKSDIWKDVLGENPSQSIKRFVTEGLIAPGDLKSILEYKYKVNELKGMLKQRGMPVSGRKENLIDRLVNTDSAAMRKSVIGLNVLVCTQAGSKLAEKYLAEEKQKRINVEQRVLDFIKRRMFREASSTMAAFEAEQVFPRGIGVDWKHYNSAHDVEMVNSIFNSKPRILSKLSDDKLEILSQGAAMMALWGKNMAQEWLPPNFETGLTFDVNTASRMFQFYAMHKANIEQYRKSGVVKYVEILGAEDSCDACRKIAKKKYKLSEVPELPYEHCTHEMGCRCTEAPVV